MKSSGMVGLFFLWTLHIACVSSLQIKPFEVYDFSKPVKEKPRTRVYGGMEAQEGEYPFMIFTLFKTSDERRGRCSSSLVNENWVLTAAHCVSSPGLRPRNIIMVGGRSDLREYADERFSLDWEESVNETVFGVEERRAEAFFIHPYYTMSDELITHDVALIKLQRPFNSTSITTIPMAFDKITRRKTCTILGWGITREDYKNYQLNVVREKEISTSRIGCRYVAYYPIICLKPDGVTGICGGDSGSPLVCDGKVRGVASYVLTNSNKCGDSLEEYYAELSAEDRWITSVINEGSGPGMVGFARAFATTCLALWMTGKILN